MRFAKIFVIVLVLGVGAKYFPVIYYTSQFNDFAQKEIARTKALKQMKAALFEKAELYFIPLKVEDIEVRENGPDFKVKVAYQVPVDLIVYKHNLSFQVAGSGRLPTD